MSSLFSRIVVGVDEGQPSDRAVAFGARLAQEHQGTLVLCHAVDWVPAVAQTEIYVMVDPNPVIESLRVQGKALLDEAAQIARGYGIEPELRLEDGDPVKTLLKAAEDSASLIVTGTHGRSNIGRLVLGSVTDAVLRGSRLPVLVVRGESALPPPERRTFERLFVAIDDSAPADAAAGLVFALPPEDRKHVTFCSVVDVDAMMGSYAHYLLVRDHLRDQATLLVHAVAESARPHGISAHGEVLWGPAAEMIVRGAATQRADLIVIGSHGRRGVRRFFLGSVAEHVVRTAHEPVLVVRSANA